MYTTQNIFVLYYVYISVKEGIFMATKKAASTKKKTTAKKTAASKTTVRTVSAEKVEAPKKETAAAKPTTTKRSSVKLPSNIINIIFAELIGTFVLTLVALTTFKDGGVGALAIGFTLVMLVMSIGAVSGSHVNPAVTFGLWTMRKLKTILLPFYWGAQFIGAMLAVIVTNWVTGGSINFGFSGFSSMNWSIFGIELVGTAIFLFGLAAVLSREETCNTGKALGVGLALAVGILRAVSWTFWSSFDSK
jgi:aquaporin Z